ncbi:MAG TPA: hypothetical protein VFA09_00570 [Ktedonobacteraceae bacterium]|nr:hypothetical protein [Ktedonobacteraceae bacterium]
MKSVAKLVGVVNFSQVFLIEVMDAGPMNRRWARSIGPYGRCA